MPSGFFLAAFFHMEVKHVQELPQQEKTGVCAIKSKLTGILIIPSLSRPRQQRN